MAYVITELCIDTKDASCVSVCPVECIHPMPDEEGFEEAKQLYIDPEDCIDCDACISTCPADAIFPEGEVPEEHRTSVQANADRYADAH